MGEATFSEEQVMDRAHEMALKVKCADCPAEVGEKCKRVTQWQKKDQSGAFRTYSEWSDNYRPHLARTIKGLVYRSMELESN